MNYSVSLPKKFCSIWVSGHGYQPVSQQEQRVSMGTRSQSQITSNGLLDVFQLSMAGLANVTTDMGIIYKNFADLKQKGKFFTDDIVKLLKYRSTEYATLTWLVHKIYSNQYDERQENMVGLKLEELKKEMLILEELASIGYARYSPPTIIKNPHFNKVYSLRPNPGENIRNESSSRSNSVRLKGQAQYNKVWAFYGLYILDTSDPEHEGFSISNLPQVNKYGFVDPQEIIERNLLTLKNYTKWKHYLDARDFSGVPDGHVSNIGDDLEASVAIFKKFCEYTGIAYSVRRRKVVLKHSDPIIATHIETLRGDVTLAADTIRDAIRQLHESANIVSDARAEFKRTADLANKAEDKYQALLNRAATSATTTKFFSQISEPTTLREYESAEAKWQEAKTAFDQAKANDTLAIENAQQVEYHVSEVIIAAIKKCIDDIILSFSSEEHTELKKILKNIIMSNKLKNILKTAIFNKKISLNQIILFFSGLEYQELGIADPACFVAKPLENPLAVDNTMQLDTQQLDDPSFTQPPVFEDILDFIKKKLYPPMGSPKRRRSGVSSPSRASRWGGGTKRKRRMRRRRYTRRRSR
jgi:hypothetical protein